MKDLVAKYDAIVKQCEGFERKGKTVPYTSANSFMFSFFNKEGEFGVRLPKERAAEFKIQHNSDIFMSHGAVMKDYVKVPLNLFDSPKEMQSLLEESFAYVMSLPVKKKKK